MAQWKQALGAVCWACVGLCLYWAEFGEVFFLLSLIIGIWISLDKSHQRTGGEKLAGTFAPSTEQFMPGLVVASSTKPTKLYTAPEVFEDNKKRPKYTGKKVPRNSPCPCGSRMKYSKCCGNASLKNITYDDLSLSDSE